MIRKFLIVFAIFFLLTVIVYSVIILSKQDKIPLASTVSVKNTYLPTIITTVIKVTSTTLSENDHISTTTVKPQATPKPETTAKLQTSREPSTEVKTQGAATMPITTIPKTDPPIATTKVITTTKTLSTTKPIITTVAPPITEKPIDYNSYIDPSGDNWSDQYLLLVNAENPIGPDYEKSVSPLSNIVSSSLITNYNYGRFMNFELNECALRALTVMILEAERDGIKNLYPVSAYRNYAYQDKLFSNNVKLTHNFICVTCGINWIGKSSICPVCGQKAVGELPVSIEEKEKNVATYSCRPGTSDHQTGLVVDLVQTSLPNKYLHLIQEFGDTEAGKWLEENCTRFGFILRFPKDKEDITGIIYEPWHFRFVGKTHAEKMRELGMCLEEYTEYLLQ